MPYIHHAPPTELLLVERGFPKKLEPRIRLPRIARCNMQSLIDAFPCLRAKDLVWLPNEDSRPFAKRARATCHSTGERLAADFVLHVWNHHDHRFMFADAMNVLGGDNLAAIQAWVLDPWYM